MKKNIDYTVVILLLLIVASPLMAQDFSTYFESFEAEGVVDSYYVFEGPITNLTEGELTINWRKEVDLPAESWELQICQLSRFCWPDWVDEETILLQPNQVDTFQVKFYPYATEGVGTATIYLTIDGNEQPDQELNFQFEARPLAVPQREQEESLRRLEWIAGSGDIGFISPIATNASLTLYDIRGSEVATLWRGVSVAGQQTIPFVRPNGLASGVYLLRLDADNVGAISRKITLIR